MDSWISEFLNESSSWCLLIIHTNNKSMTLINHAPWCSQCQNMIPINQISSPLHRWGVIPVCNRHQVEGRGGIGESSFSVGRWNAVMSHSFLGEGYPLRTQGEGARRGGGTVMSHSFQVGGGGPWWVTLSKEGWGTEMSHPKGGQGRRGAPPIKTRGGRWRCHR